MKDNDREAILQVMIANNLDVEILQSSSLFSLFFSPKSPNRIIRKALVYLEKSSERR